MHDHGDIGAEIACVDTTSHRGFAFFAASRLLVVQADALERYGERATLSFDPSRPQADNCTSRVENARRAAALTAFRSGAAAEVKPIL